MGRVSSLGRRGLKLRGAAIVTAHLLAGVASQSQAQPAIPAAAATEAERLEALARGAAGLPPPAAPSSFRVGASVWVTATDNGALSSNETKKSDVLTEVNPYVIATANRPDARATLFYGLRAINSLNKTISNRVLHDLRGVGDFALIGDDFRLSARTLVTDINASPFSVNSADAATTPGANRVRYQRYELSPYYIGSIGNFAEYQLRYRAAYNDSGVPQIKTTEQAVSAIARSNNEASLIGWQSTAQGSQRRFDNDYRYGSSAFSFTAYAAPTPTFRLGVSANYAKVDIVVDDQGRTNGWGPGLYAQWTPSQRTAFSLVAARQYYGNTGSLRLIHRAADWTFSLIGSRALLSPIESNVLFLDPTQEFSINESRPVSNPIVETLIQQGLTSAAGSLFSSGISTAALAMDSRVRASVGYLGSGNSVLFSVYSSRLTGVPLTADARGGLPPVFAGSLIDSNGGGVTYRYAVSAATALLFRASQTNWRNEGADAFTHLRSFSAGYFTRWSPSWGGALEYRNNRQRSSGTASAGYDQQSIVILIDARY